MLNLLRGGGGGGLGLSLLVISLKATEHPHTGHSPRPKSSSLLSASSTELHFKQVPLYTVLDGVPLLIISIKIPKSINGIGPLFETYQVSVIATILNRQNNEAETRTQIISFREIYVNHYTTSYQTKTPVTEILTL